MDSVSLPVIRVLYVYVYTLVCLLCVWLTWIVGCDTDKWRCTLRSRSQRLNPSWLSLLISSSYYLSVKERGGGPASVCQKTIRLHGDPILSPAYNSLSHFLTLRALWLSTVIQKFPTPSNAAYKGACN